MDPKDDSNESERQNRRFQPILIPKNHVVTNIFLDVIALTKTGVIEVIIQPVKYSVRVENL